VPACRYAPPVREKALRHEPALDGLRGVAVLLVLLYHGGVAWAGGGFLGVEIFFVLSGFLITKLLLVEVESTGAIAFGGFWVRRARRLLPALFCVVLVCTIYESVVGPSRAVPDFGADALAALFYVANWHQLWIGSGYFTQLGQVSPLQHTWSLGIEEQFYLTWPILLSFVLGRRGRLRLLLVLTALGSVASALEMAFLYHGGSGIDRVYYGTDTRAQSLLVGAALATGVALWQRRAPAWLAGLAGPGRALSGAAVAAVVVGTIAAVGLGLAVAYARGEAGWLYRFGLFGVDLACATLIASVTLASRRVSPVAVVLTSAPLRATGLISYGLYLWHFPLFLWLTAASTGVSGAPLLWLRLAVSFAVATVSYLLIEQPVRRGRLHGVALRRLLPASAAAVLAGVAAAWTATGVAAGPLPGGLSSSESLTVPRAATSGVQSYHAADAPARGTVRVLIVGDSIALTLAWSCR
jgi:peptidoglycan/LPS O-acetylase OafA/YrhL